MACSAMRSHCDAEGGGVELWALYASRRLLSIRMPAFLDYLRQAFPNGTLEELAGFIGRRRRVAREYLGARSA